MIVGHLQGLRRKCEIHHWMHTHASYINQRWSWGMSMPSILINATMAVLSQHMEVQGMPVAISVVFVLNAVLVTAKEYLKVDQRVQFHTHQSSAFSALMSEIDKLLVKDTATVGNTEFDHILTVYTSLTEQKDYLIPETLWEQAEQQAQSISTFRSIQIVQ
jgi:hypothetical protein